MMASSFRFIDLFAGIGGFRLALEAVGGYCVASAEVDAQAIQVYQANWPHSSRHHNLGDVTQLHELPPHDLLVGGVPCQPWSIAGKNMGDEDPRGQLWNDVIRLVERNRPAAFIFENVKGLVDPRHSDFLEYLLGAFRRAGYTIHVKLLNAFDYGVPQNRDRVILVGLHRKHATLPFQFPAYRESTTRLFDIFDNIERPEGGVSEVLIQRDLFGERTGVGFNKLTPKEHRNEFFVLNDIRHGATSIHSWEIWETTERERLICMTILRNRRNKKYGPCDGNPMRFEDVRELIPDLARSELEALVAKRILCHHEHGRYEFAHRRLSGGIEGTYRIFLPDARFFGTLTARGMKDAVAEAIVRGDTTEEYKRNFVERVLRPKRFRPITTREAARLQGFPETFQLHTNDAASQRLLGNSVAIPVIKAVAESLVHTGVFNCGSLEEIAA